MPRRSQAQLIHAKASAKAQLINAHQMRGGAGGSAPLVHAPTPYSRRDYARFSPVTEVGGDKKKDKPTGVAIRDSYVTGENANTLGTGSERASGRNAVNDGSGLSQWHVGHKQITAKEFNNIMDRGMRGASLNAWQRAVFEASKKEYDEEQAEKKRLAEEERVRKVKQEDAIAEEKRSNEEWDRRQKVQREAQIAEEQRRRGYAQEDFDRRQQAILDAEKRAADAENEKRIARNRQYGLPDDYQATDADYKGLANRTHEYGYSPEDQKRVDDFNAEIAKVREDTTLSPEQRDAAIADLQGRIDGIGKAVYKRPDAVAEPQMSTIKGDDGQEYRVWSPDGKSWQLFDKKDPEVKEPTMNGLTFKDVVGMFKGRKVATGQTDDDGTPIMRDMTPEEMIAAAQKSWKPDANVPAPTSSAPTPQGGGESFGLRNDGKTYKGTGWLGKLNTADGSVATEYTVGVNIDGKEMDIPTLVPTLTKDEVDLMVNDIIPNKRQIPDSIMQKAADHAKMRLKNGQSVFANDGQQQSSAQESTPTPQPEDIKSKWSQYED